MSSQIMDEYDNVEPDADSLHWPRRRVIMSYNGKQGPLLVRYFLLHTKPLSIFLHHLMQSDDERRSTTIRGTSSPYY